MPQGDENRHFSGTVPTALPPSLPPSLPRGLCRHLRLPFIYYYVLPLTPLGKDAAEFLTCSSVAVDVFSSARNKASGSNGTHHTYSGTIMKDVRIPQTNHPAPLPCPPPSP